MFVLDCSVTMAWCFLNEQADYADAMLTRLATETALVPSLWHLEVINVLLVGQRKGRISKDQTQEFLMLAQKLDIQTDTTSPDIEDRDFIDLATQYQLSAYDTAYLNLAIREKLPLASLDKKLIEVSREIGLYLA